MNKILMPILLIALYLNPLQAQIKQGSWMIGGSGQFYQTRSFEKTGRPNTTFKHESLYLNPELGYFVTNRWMIGAYLGMSSSKLTFTALSGQAQQITNYESYSFNPFTRIYFTPQHRFKLFYEFYGGGAIVKSKGFSSFFDSIQGKSSFALGNSIGANYFLTDNISMEGSINYYFYNQVNYTTHSTETYFPKFVLNPTLRMRLFLNTKGEKMEFAQTYFAQGNLTYGLRMNLLLNGNSQFNASSFTPNIGYFLMDNLMIGGEFSIYYAPNSLFGFHLTPKIRYYQPFSRLTQGFVQTLIGSIYSVSNETGVTSKFKKQEIEIGAGINRFLAPNISVQGSLNASVSKNNSSSLIEFKPNLKVGFQYFMSKK